MTHFTIQGTSDVHSMKELGLNILGNNFRKRSVFFYALYLVIIAFCVYCKFFFLAAACILILALYPIRFFHAARKICRLNLRRAEEANCVVYEYHYEFNDDSFHYHSATSGRTGDFRYSDLIRVVDTQSSLYLLTKADQLFPITKSDASADQLSALAAFLQGKGVKVPSMLVQKS